MIKNEVKVVRIVYVQFFYKALLHSKIDINFTNSLNDNGDFDNMKREECSYCFIKH